MDTLLQSIADIFEMPRRSSYESFTGNQFNESIESAALRNTIAEFNKAAESVLSESVRNEKS